MQLPHLIRAYEKMNKISTRKLAKEIGVDYTALYRFERGRNVQFRKFSKIMLWLVG